MNQGLFSKPAWWTPMDLGISSFSPSCACSLYKPQGPIMGGWDVAPVTYILRVHMKYWLNEINNHSNVNMLYVYAFYRKKWFESQFVMRKSRGYKSQIYKDWLREHGLHSKNPRYIFFQWSNEPYQTSHPPKCCFMPMSVAVYKFGLVIKALKSRKSYLKPFLPMFFATIWYLRLSKILNHQLAVGWWYPICSDIEFYFARLDTLLLATSSPSSMFDCLYHKIPPLLLFRNPSCGFLFTDPRVWFSTFSMFSISLVVYQCPNPSSFSPAL